MKKLLLFSLIVICSCSFVGCSSDFEENEVSDFEKVEDAKLKIMEMANDYDLSVDINDNALLENCISDNLYFEQLNSLFASLSKIRGRYLLINIGKTKELTQQWKKQRLYSKNYSYESYKSYEFNDTTLIGDNYSFTCGCEVKWIGNYKNVEVIGDVSCGQMIQGYCESAISPEVKEGRIYFDGKVTYVPSGTLRIYFNVTGWCTEEEGEINWH